MEYSSNLVRTGTRSEGEETWHTFAESTIRLVKRSSPQPPIPLPLPLPHSISGGLDYRGAQGHVKAEEARSSLTLGRHSSTCYRSQGLFLDSSVNGPRVRIPSAIQSRGGTPFKPNAEGYLQPLIEAEEVPTIPLRPLTPTPSLLPPLTTERTTSHSNIPSKLVAASETLARTRGSLNSSPRSGQQRLVFATPRPNFHFDFVGVVHPNPNMTKKEMFLAEMEARHRRCVYISRRESFPSIASVITRGIGERVGAILIPQVSMDEERMMFELDA
ncbi:hypothetical protein C8Q75DRAFT_808026 [Abortiporus biennis]|nr:hypothetical protein C8Q75DRAFT_808026 [Abortiporus biennis]